MSYGNESSFNTVTGYTVDMYGIREKAAVARLRRYCLQFPTEAELDELTEYQLDCILNAIYFQIVYEYDNNLLNSNGEDVASVSIGNFSYSKGMTYKGKGDTGVYPYSKTALVFLKDSDICDSSVGFAKESSWWECGN